jgi:hypothetical protein
MAWLSKTWRLSLVPTFLTDSNRRQFWSKRPDNGLAQRNLGKDECFGLAVLPLCCPFVFIAPDRPAPAR